MQTDNGGMYTFCPHWGNTTNCNEELLGLKASLDDAKIPTGYMSYQGAWWLLDGSAPWCVSEWVHNPARNYPMTNAEFQKRLQLPVQLYAPYFCNDTAYASEWPMLSSDQSIPNCGGYSFKDVHPDSSEDFYSWLYAKGDDWGMMGFEPDFLNQNYACVDEFITNVSAAPAWLDGMAHAAEARGYPIQWCYSTPAHLLQVPSAARASAPRAVCCAVRRVAHVPCVCHTALPLPAPAPSPVPPRSDTYTVSSLNSAGLSVSLGNELPCFDGLLLRGQLRHGSQLHADVGAGRRAEQRHPVDDPQ
jgi:hypothetical protein